MGGKLLSDLPWLKSLLEVESEFYSFCECKRKYCSFYCMDCMVSPFCDYCNIHSLKHEGHECIRVYKSSTRPGIRIRVIKEFMDVSYIQPFICNSSKLVYIKRKRSRPINISRRGDGCEVCGYELQSPASKFCSIECKVDEEMDDFEEERNNEEDGNDDEDEYEYEADSLKKRRRKGKPRRSPFF